MSNSLSAVTLLNETDNSSQRLTQTSPAFHSVQLYQSDAFLVDNLAELVGSALGGGSSAIVIATEAHLAALCTRLHERGFDLTSSACQARMVMRDAAESLTRFMVAGRPDWQKFKQFAEGLIERVGSVRADTRPPTCFIFGEMVALLWAEGNRSAAIELERLWNEFAKHYSFQLHCAYPLHSFPDEADRAQFAQICKEHSHVLPTEAFTTLSSDDEQFRKIVHLEQKAQALETETRKRNLLQKEVRQREEELQDFLDNAVIGMHWVSASGEILWANKAELDLLGYQRDEYIGRNIAEFHADSAALQDIMERLARFEELRGYETQLRCKDGSVRDVRIDSNVFVRDGVFCHSRCFTTDITEQKKAEQARAHLAAIVESSEDAIISKSLDGIVTSWNKAAERILEYRAEEMIGRSITTIIPPDLLSDEPIILGKIRRGEQIKHFETVRMNKSGQRLDVSLTISPIRDREGRIVGAAKILRDVTEQKKMEAALRTTERLAAVGRLAATISHEINNPLESVMNLVYLAEIHPEASPIIKQYLALGQQELNRAIHISRQTLGFYRSTSTAAWVDVADSVEAVLGIYNLKFRYKGLKIRREIQPELRIKIEAGELKQIMSNLISNACDACLDNCEILIRVHAASIGKDRIPGVRFTVADTGVGIPDEVKSKIFAPFFTTKEVVGTGLGLWITKSLVEKRGGNIFMRSRTDAPSGTVMSFTLPFEATEARGPRTEALAA